MYCTVSSFPPIDTIPQSLSTSSITTKAGKRQWETNHTGYVKWALRQLVAWTTGADSGGGGAAMAAMDRLDAIASEIGTANNLQWAVEVIGNMTQALSQVEQQEQRSRQEQPPKDEGDNDDRMQE